jgi:hypothetical protein
MNNRYWLVVGAVIGVVASFLVVRHYSFKNVQCPCGFVYVYPPGGCQVDINHQNPCPNEPPPPPPPPPPHGGSGGTGSGEFPYQPPIGACDISANCNFTPDFNEAWIVLGSPGYSPTFAGVKLHVEIQSRSIAKACNQLIGIVSFPSGTMMKIPLDAVKAVAMYPDLLGRHNDNCDAHQFNMLVQPVDEKSRDCGCRITKFKP